MGRIVVDLLFQFIKFLVVIVVLFLLYRYGIFADMYENGTEYVMKRRFLVRYRRIENILSRRYQFRYSVIIQLDRLVEFKAKR